MDMPRSRSHREIGGGPPRTRRGMLLALALLGLTGGSAHAQVRVEGRVVQPAGGPLNGQTVLLHRVTPTGGVLLAEAVTDSAGGFVLTSDEQTVADGVYFVASRVEGQLYIGPMLRPPLPETTYILEVGQGAVPFQPVPAMGAEPPPVPGAAIGTPRRWALLLIPLAGLLGLIGWAMARATGPAPGRRLMIEIARLDNAWADAPGDRDAYERQRRRLLDQLDAT